MQNWAVRKKLLGCFGAVLAMVAALGAFTIDRLGATRSAAAEIETIWLPSVQVLYRMQATLLARRIELTRHIAYDDAAVKTRQEMKIAALDREFESEGREYIPLISSPEEQTVYNRLASAWEPYLDVSGRVLALSRALDRKGAITLSTGEGTMRAQALQAAIKDDIDLNLRGAKESGVEARSTYTVSRNLILATVVLIGGVVVGALQLLTRQIAEPIRATTGVMTELAGGNLGVALPDADRADELGEMAKTLVVFRDAARAKAAAERERADAARVRDEVMQTVGSALDTLAQGRLNCDLATAFPPEFERLRTDFNEAVARLREAMGSVIAGIASIRSATGEIAQASDDLSHRTESQAATLEQTSAALEQTTAAVRKTAANAQHATERMTVARSSAIEGGDVAERAIGAMSQIQQSSAKIGAIVGVIDEIAYQTNLLALNAAVEAARAGDAGRGFAVVASEVRNLAQRSSEAAKEIKGLIAKSGEHVSDGAELVGRSGAALKRIVDEVVSVDALFTEIAEAAESQAHGLSEISIAVGQMDANTQQNAAMVEESTAATRMLAGQTDELAASVELFELGSASRGVHAIARGRGRRDASPAYDDFSRAAA